MEKRTYIIEYEAQSTIGAILRSGKMRVKNKTSSIQAQMALEDYLKRHVTEFDRLIVNSCKVDTLGNLFSMFGCETPFR